MLNKVAYLFRGRHARLVVTDPPYGIGLISVRPRFDKEVRLLAQAPRFEAGQVFLPRQAPWLAPYLAELWPFRRPLRCTGHDRIRGWIGCGFVFRMEMGADAVRSMAVAASGLTLEPKTYR